MLRTYNRFRTKMFCKSLRIRELEFPITEDSAYRSEQEVLEAILEEASSIETNGEDPSTRYSDFNEIWKCS